MTTATEISAKYLAKKLFTSYAKECIKLGKNEKEIKEGFTIEKLNEMTKDFCEKYNFKIK